MSEDEKIGAMWCFILLVGITFLMILEHFHLLVGFALLSLTLVLGVFLFCAGYGAILIFKALFIKRADDD